MSRVDDDRDAARAAERLAQQKRADEAKRKDQVAQENAFSRLVAQQKTASQQGQAAQQQREAVAKSAIAHLLEQAEGQGQVDHGDAERQQLAKHASAKSQAGSAQAKQQAQSSGDARLQAAARGADGEAQAQTTAGRSADQAGAAHGTEGRRDDAKTSRERIEERRQPGTPAASTGAGGARGEKGELKTDADKGGQGQQNKGDQKGGEGAQASAFRFNPALMAPPPVAQKRDLSGQERLRRIAAEIAQKIVERVRVGTNTAGKMEFQIDLRNDVLSGLQVKVSSSNGKIRAVFSGKDRDVLKLLEQQRDSLKSALQGRGLTLEDLVIEAKA